MSTQVEVPVAVKTPDAPFGAADLLRVVAKRKSLIAFITVLVVLATAAVMLSLPTLYATTAKVMLDPRKNNVADAATVLSAFPTDPASVQNQIQVLGSRDLALKVIAKLHLDDDPEFNPGLAGRISGDPRDVVVSAFLSHLDVAQNGASTTIDVTFKSRDAEKAARIANALARSYTDDQVAVKVTAARKAGQWLSERVQALAAQVQQQESAVQLYKAENDLVESSPGSSLTDQQLMAINTQLVTAQSEYAEKKAAYDRVAALSKTGNGGDTTQVVTSKMIGDLRAQEGELIRQEADLASRYGPNHPKMIAVKNARRDLAAKIAREVDGIAGSMQSDLEIAKAHLGAIEASLARTGRQARQENVARIKLKALEANLASTRTMYENFVQRLRAVQDQDDIQLPEARVISTAPVPAFPASPKRTLFIGASIPAGFLLGVLVALLLERCAPMVAGFARRPEPVAEKPRAPVFAPAPVASPAPVFAPAPAFAQAPLFPPAPAFAPAYTPQAAYQPAPQRPEPQPPRYEPPRHEPPRPQPQRLAPEPARPVAPPPRFEAPPPVQAPPVPPPPVPTPATDGITAFLRAAAARRVEAPAPQPVPEPAPQPPLPPSPRPVSPPRAAAAVAPAVIPSQPMPVMVSAPVQAPMAQVIPLYPQNAAPPVARPTPPPAPPPAAPAMPPVLGEIAGSADLRLADWVLENPGSPYGKALEQLLAGVLEGSQQKGCVVTITAPSADASKPVAALSLARFAAMRGLRTVLIDADLGRLAPAGANAGIAGFLQGLPLASVMLKDRCTPLLLMAAPGAVWPERRTAELLAYLKQNCDLVIVEAAAPQGSGAWPALAGLSDSVLLYAAAKAPQAGLEASLRSLVAMGRAPKGLILVR